MTIDDLNKLLTELGVIIAAVYSIVTFIRQRNISTTVENTKTTVENTKATVEDTKATVEQTAEKVNGHADALMALVEKQRVEMHEAGLPPTKDDSLPPI